MDISKFIEAGGVGLEWRKLGELEEGQMYEITKISKGKGTYGDSVVVETDDFQLNLPQRFAKFSAKELQALVGRKFAFGGVENSYHIVNFE